MVLVKYHNVIEHRSTMYTKQLPKTNIITKASYSGLLILVIIKEQLNLTPLTIRDKI